MKIGLLSDTHSHMDDRILSYLKPCDEIWHAGDIGDLKVIDALNELGPVRVVYGNIDNHLIRSEFAKNELFEIEGFKIWMTHIGGRPGRYSPGIHQRLIKESIDIFICGHSHICKVVMDKKTDSLYLNPGAAGISGFHQVRTLLRFDLKDKNITNMEVVELGKRA